MEDERVVLSLNVQPDGPRYLVRLDKLFFAGRKNEKNAVSHRVYITFPSLLQTQADAALLSRLRRKR